jgi:uroporphyrin-III C-methyltransferase/precorrin-2 dehydrogenase/sirohydrochlorin ferrochelatase
VNSESRIGLNSLPLTTGCVYLVGAGPGDPDLLTLRAWRLMQAANVLVYDRLVSDEILDMVPADVERVTVGKVPGNHCVPQDQINALLIARARSGQRILRLKGGDPYIFGRGGEEAEALVEARIPFEVVPGITAAAGASSYCGIPLTHRDYSQSVTFATGHLKDDSANLDWQSLARANTTLVVYMGMASLPFIAGKLIEHGRDASTPVAAVHRATQAQQRIVIGTLATIGDSVAEAGISSPAAIIVGEVVSLHDKLHQALPASLHSALTAIS